MDTSIFCYWLFWFAIASLLGFLLAWFLRAAKIKGWESEFNRQKNVHTKLETEHNSLLQKSSGWSAEKRNLIDAKKGIGSELSELRLSFNAYKTKFAAIESEKTRMESRIQTLKKDSATMHDLLNDKEKIIADLNAGKGAYGSELEKLRTALEEARKEKTAVKPQIDTYKERFETANLERNTLKAKYEATISKINGYNDEINTYRLEAEQARTAIPQYEKDLETERQKYQDLLKNIEAERAQMATEKSKLADFESSKEDLQLKYNSLLRLQEQNTDTFRAEKNELAAQVKELADIKIQWHAMNDEKTNWRAEKRELQATIETFKAKYEQSLKAAAPVLAPAPIVQNNDQQITQLKGQIEEYKPYKSKWIALSQENTALASQIQALQTSGNAPKTVQAKTVLAPTPTGTNNDQQITQLKGQIEEYKPYKSKWIALNRENTALASQIQALQTSGNAPKTVQAKTVLAPTPTGTNNDQQITQLKGQIEEYKPYKSKWIALNREKQNWAALANENKQLKADLKAAKNNTSTSSGKLSKEEKAARSEAAKASLQAAIGTKIVAATVTDKDFLQEINGIGPFIEDKLNNLGIFTFQQISQLDIELIQIVTDAIQFFPGRIERDDWVGQATDLHKKE